MRKITNILVNVITVITLLIGVVSAIYLALPIDLQDKIPLNIKEVILLLIANGGLGGFLAIIRVFRNNDKLELGKQNGAIIELFNELSVEVIKLRKENEIKDNEILAKINRDIELKEADLKIKKSNPMLKEEHKEMLDKLGV
jgi:hypothetical protein